MSVAIDSEMPSQVGASVTSASSLSYSFTNTAGTLLLCGIGGNSSTGNFEVIGLTYGGVKLGDADARRPTGTASPPPQANAAEIHHLLNPLTGSNTLLITMATNSLEIESGCLTVTGHHTTNPIGQVVTARGTTNPATLAVPGTTSGSMIVDCVATGTSVTSNTQTRSWLKNVDAGSSAGNGAQQRAAGSGGSVTMQYGITADSWGLVALEVMPTEAAAAMNTTDWYTA